MHVTAPRGELIVPARTSSRASLLLLLLLHRRPFSLVRLRLLSPRLVFDSLPHARIMDKIVSQYTRSPHQNEFYSEQEQQELTETLPPISLKFNLPPLDNVSWDYCVGYCGRSWSRPVCGCGGDADADVCLCHLVTAGLDDYSVLSRYRYSRNVRPRLIIISRSSPLVSSVR